MKIVKANPFFQGRSLTNILDDVFNKSFMDMTGADFSLTTPSVNIIEGDADITLEVAAPGLEKSDFNIALDNDQLTISASKENQTEDSEEGKWSRREFNYSTFKRTFYLDDSVDAEKINASYENG